VSEIKYHIKNDQFSDKFKFYSDSEKIRMSQMVKGNADALRDF